MTKIENTNEILIDHYLKIDPPDCCSYDDPVYIPIIKTK